MAAGYFTVTLRKVTHSFAIAVELEGGWPDILRGRKKPTEAERALWGGDMKEPDLVAQLIKIKVIVASTTSSSPLLTYTGRRDCGFSRESQAVSGAPTRL